MWPFDEPFAIIDRCRDQAKKTGTELDNYYDMESCAIQKAEDLDLVEQLVLDGTLSGGKRRISRDQIQRSIRMGDRKAHQKAVDAYNQTTREYTPTPLAEGFEATDKALEGDFGDIPGSVGDSLASRYLPGHKQRKKIKKLKEKMRRKSKDKKRKDGMAVSGDCDI